MTIPELPDNFVSQVMNRIEARQALREQTVLGQLRRMLDTWSPGLGLPRFALGTASGLALVMIVSWSLLGPSPSASSSVRIQYVSELVDANLDSGSGASELGSPIETYFL